MRYIQGTLDLKLYLGGENNALKGFCDADWMGDTNDRRSSIEYVFFLGIEVIFVELQEAIYYCIVYHKGKIHGY